MKRTFIGCTLASLTILSAFGAQPATAQNLSEEALMNALAPPAQTRSLSSSVRPNPAQKDDEAFIDSLRGKPSRSLTVSDRARLQTVSADKPAADLTMEFDYASAVMRPDAVKTADRLGKVLSSPALQNKTFVLAGHTDAKGSDEINQKLSERRAEAVKDYLVKRFNIKATNLIAVGYGKTRLRNPNEPMSPENRRVQAVNVLPNQSASQ